MVVRSTMRDAAEQDEGATGLADGRRLQDAINESRLRNITHLS